jgi:hypothetical protein
MFSSAGIVSANSWTALSPAKALASVGHRTDATKYVRFCGGWKVLKRNSVTTPIDPPAPRNAQKRSGFSVSEQLTTVELARTTVAPTSQSRASPCV